MTQPPKRAGQPAGAARDGVGLATPQDPGPGRCSCCAPPNLLVPRPDLGLLADGSARYALCVLHEPEPTVYGNRGGGRYERLDGLSFSSTGELLDAAGAVVASVGGDDFQRLTTLDDEALGADAAPGEPASRPRTVHVDLTEDDFYARGRPATAWR